MTFILRPYNPEQDGLAVYQLYRKIFGDRWPLRFETFRQVTSEHAFYHPGDHFVAGSEGKVTGFAATQITRPLNKERPVGGLGLLMVSSGYQRSGIGRALHNIAIDHLKTNGIKAVLMGGGGMLRLWPGIPEEMGESVPFFEKLGWRDFHRSCDLVRELGDYTIPADLQRRMTDSGFDIHPARPEEIPAILDFERVHFPHWYVEYAYKTAIGEHADILAAWDADHEVVGATLLFTPGSKLLNVNLLWKEILGERVGGIGAVGVAESARGGGIGIALVAWGSAVLQERGVTTSMIDWTGLVDFYGKAGYLPWRWYQTPAALQLDG